MKRIAVVGRGTAGSHALIHMLRWMPDSEIVWHFDSKVPTQLVGEGTTLEFGASLFENIGFSHRDLPRINGNFKTGVLKRGWGSKGVEFFHDFGAPNVSYHFDAKALQDFIYEKVSGKVKVIDEPVDFLNLDADYIVNATGRPSDFSDYSFSDCIPVNAAYVSQIEWDGPKFNYSLMFAAKHGWIFGIPLAKRCAIGYVYNSDISSEEELWKEVEEVKKEFGLGETSWTARFSFPNYARNFFLDGNVVYTGNAGLFLEPLEASAFSAYDFINRSAIDVWRDGVPAWSANQKIKDFVSKTEFVIMLHYAAGSPYKTEFWDFAQQKGIERISQYDSEFLSIYKDVSKAKRLEDCQPPRHYSIWWDGSFYQNFKGMNLYPILDKVLATNPPMDEQGDD